MTLHFECNTTPVPVFIRLQSPASIAQRIAGTKENILKRRIGQMPTMRRGHGVKICNEPRGTYYRHWVLQWTLLELVVMDALETGMTQTWSCGTRLVNHRSRIFSELEFT